MILHYHLDKHDMDHRAVFSSSHRCAAIKAVLQFIGWKQTAGAVGVAWDKIQSDGILPEQDVLNLSWALTDCDKSLDAGAIIEWSSNGFDVVLGPACSSSAIVSGTVAKSFDFPMVIWAPTFSSVLVNADDYPTVMASTWSAERLVQSMGALSTTPEDTIVDNINEEYDGLVEYLQVSAMKAESLKATKRRLSPQTLD
ncbi:Receptor-type guanylate cyclase gcy-22 [Parelaphostrongylus tenuis]|uniref:Receptor-type guanylate cyclase gcy-22 n=1 Tax=Parelaphostrongylus tenuis TaxID=148309 RepID=A0AAD5LYP5_PARTN|nr:Receptor-type guanylate cyclase gcy-22 [Parelaphostrongylus tenuis]